MKTSMPLSSMVRLFTFVILISVTSLPPLRGETADGVEKGVRLVLSSRQIEPTTTFELRFDEAMVAFDKIGTVADECPVRIGASLANDDKRRDAVATMTMQSDSALPGKFTWLSQRSGVFKPSEPPVLGTRYQVTLKPGLKNAAGALISATLDRVLVTPPFTATSFSPHDFPQQNAPANPEINIQFNVDVAADTAKKFILFRNEENTEVPAIVSQTKRNSDYYFNGGEPRTWKDRFLGREPVTSRQADGDKDAVIPNCLFATPARPLPISKGWKLVLKKDLPSADGATHFPESVELDIGDVIPFAVDEIRAHNGVDTGKTIVINFSKRISPMLKPEDLAKWISISPVPANLKMEPAWDAITLSADFSVTEHYTVTVKAGLPASVPFSLEKEEVRTLAFEPLPPRLYFPAFSTHQISGGRRTFDLRSVNNRDVLVQARLLTRDSIVPALRGYNGMYYKDSETGEGENYEPYRKFDPLVLGGQTIYEHHFQPAGGRDATKFVPMNWDDILGSHKTGAVFLSAESSSGKTVGAQSLVQVTDLGLLWKYSKEDVLVYLYSHRTGKPVAGATVYAISDDNGTLFSKVTDDNGVVQFAIPEKTAWLLAEKGGDLHAVSFRPLFNQGGVTDRGNYDIPIYHFSIPTRWYGDDESRDGVRKILLFTERPAYQPGETVHLKAILRDWKKNDLIIPAELTGKLTCEDSRHQRFVDQKVAFTATGAFDVSFPLPKGAVGDYDYELKIDGDQRNYNGHFLVEEYKPNAFEISVAARESYGADENVSVPISAKYYFGTPLARASVKWSIEAEDQTFNPEGFSKFQFGYCGEDDLTPAGENVSSFSIHGSGVVDAKGAFVIQAGISTNPKAPQPRSVSVLAEITDLNQQTISSRSHFVKHSSEFYIGLQPFHDDVVAGEQMPVRFVAVNTDGSPRTEPVKATVELQRVDFHIVREEGAGGAVKYHNVPEFVKVLSQQAVSGTVKKSGNDWELEPQQGEMNIAPASAGTYMLRISTRDAAGHDILTSYEFSVVEKKPVETTWAYRNEAQIDLVPDKTSYVCGEEATILVKTPISGTALVTVERNKVLRSFVVNLAGNAPTFRVPLDRNDAPNVFVSVILVRGHEQSPRKIKTPDYRVGYCQVNVMRPETKLEVSVNPKTPSSRPGQDVEVETSVKDSTGASVSGAEVTLYAVDDGVLSLTGFIRPDPYAFFYATQPLEVRSALSLPALLPEDPEQLEYSNKGYLVGDKGDEEERGHVRKDFLACAFWKADLTTDATGKVRATFKAPDSLTRYRLVAVVQTVKNQFGSAESKFEINKPLMIEPSLPRFGNITDRIEARAVLLNTMDRAGEVELAVQLDGIALSDGSSSVSRKVQIPAKGTVAVDFPVEFKQTGQTKWIWSARMTGSGNVGETFEDTVQSTLDVGFIAPMLHETLVGRTSEPETNLLANANPQFLESTGTMTVRLANTRLLGLGDAVVYLQRYRYGCVEQTSSKMIPWILAGKLGKAVPELNKTPQEINDAIESGIDRLLSMQTSSGGLSYWPGGRIPMIWASAYGGFALATAQRNGHPVPVTCLDKICDYLRKKLRDTSEYNDEYELGPRCLALYTLAISGHAEASYHEVIFKKRESLSAESRALLALAILESNGPKEMVEELINSRMPAQPQGGYWFGSSERELSVRLMAWSRFRANDPAVDTLAEELLHERKNGRWGNTQENAWAILALATYAEQVETGLKQYGGTLKYGARSDGFHLDDTTHLFETGHPIVPVTPDKQEPQPLQLLNPDKGMIFTTLQLDGRARTGKQPRQDRGYAIQRTYEKINDDGSRTETKDWHVGDRVLITLRIEVRQPAHYLAVDDPLPAVFEAVNPVFKTQEMNTGADQGMDWFTDYREIRADRALFFGDHIPPGNYTIRYTARVCAAGTVTAPAVKIEEMYHPERFGMSETEEVSSRTIK